MSDTGTWVTTGRLFKPVIAPPPGWGSPAVSVGHERPGREGIVPTLTFELMFE